MILLYCSTQLYNRISKLYPSEYFAYSAHKLQMMGDKTDGSEIFNIDIFDEVNRSSLNKKGWCLIFYDFSNIELNALKPENKICVYRFFGQRISSYFAKQQTDFREIEISAWITTNSLSVMGNTHRQLKTNCYITFNEANNNQFSFVANTSKTKLYIYEQKEVGYNLSVVAKVKYLDSGGFFMTKVQDWLNAKYNMGTSSFVTVNAVDPTTVIFMSPTTEILKINFYQPVVYVKADYFNKSSCGHDTHSLEIFQYRVICSLAEFQLVQNNRFVPYKFCADKLQYSSLFPLLNGFNIVNFFDYSTHFEKRNFHFFRSDHTERKFLSSKTAATLILKQNDIPKLFLDKSCVLKIDVVAVDLGSLRPLMDLREEFVGGYLIPYVGRLGQLS